MRKLLTLLMIFSSPVMAKPNEGQTDMICTYHAAMVAESVELMLAGMLFDDAFVKATENVDEMAGEIVLNFLEESLQALSDEDILLIGKVTGLATHFWAANFRNGHVIGTKATLFTGSYTACLAGAADTDVVTYFLTYYIILNQLSEPKSFRI